MENIFAYTLEVDYDLTHIRTYIGTFQIKCMFFRIK